MPKRTKASKKCATVTPPVVIRPDTPPLLDSQISWDRFERFVRHLIRLRTRVQNVKRYRNTGGNVGGMIAPVMTPWISGHFGWPWGIGLGGVICFLGAFCWCWIEPAPRAAQPNANPSSVS